MVILVGTILSHQVENLEQVPMQPPTGSYNVKVNTTTLVESQCQANRLVPETWDTAAYPNL